MLVLQDSGDLLRDAISTGDKEPSRSDKGCEILGLLVCVSSPVAGWLVSWVLGRLGAARSSSIACLRTGCRRNLARSFVLCQRGKSLVWTAMQAKIGKTPGVAGALEVRRKAL